MAGPAVVILQSGGVPVVNGTNGLPMTVADNDMGLGVTLVDALGLPVTLLNEDGSLWSASPEGYAPTYHIYGF